MFSQRHKEDRPSSSCNPPPQMCLVVARKKFRVRYDRSVTFDPYPDSIGIMHDAGQRSPILL